MHPLPILNLERMIGLILIHKRVSVGEALTDLPRPSRYREAVQRPACRLVEA
jgi:hypothetical protein